MAWPPRSKNPRFDVYACRKRLGLTQHQFAALVGKSDRTVIRWERDGYRPSRQVVRFLKQHERDREAGIRPERPASAPPSVRRPLPAPTVRASKLDTIGIAPSSF